MEFWLHGWNWIFRPPYFLTYIILTNRYCVSGPQILRKRCCIYTYMSFLRNKLFTQNTQNNLVFLLYSSQIWNFKMFISSLIYFNARSFPRCQVGPLRFPKVVGRLRSPCPTQPFDLDCLMTNAFIFPFSLWMMLKTT